MLNSHNLLFTTGSPMLQEQFVVVKKNQKNQSCSKLAITGSSSQITIFVKSRP